MSIQLYQEILSWFNTLNSTHIKFLLTKFYLKIAPLLLLAMTSDADWICLSSVATNKNVHI